MAKKNKGGQGKDNAKQSKPAPGQTNSAEKQGERQNTQSQKAN